MIKGYIDTWQQLQNNINVLILEQLDYFANGSTMYNKNKLERLIQMKRTIIVVRKKLRSITPVK